MLQRILKKDMKRRKSVNIILFIFITLASVFLSSSVNNILVVSSAVDYYMDRAAVPEVSLFTAGTDEEQEINDWIENEGPLVRSYESGILVILAEKSITLERGGIETSFNSNGASIYLGTSDADHCKVFDENGKSFSLNKGEIAMTSGVMERNGLEPGDKIRIAEGSVDKEFTVRLSTKDAGFGNDMAGMTRLIVSESDFTMYKLKPEADLLGMYYVDTDGAADFVRELNDQGFLSVMNSVTRATYAMAYSFDMVMASLLILIGICLILIAMLVLRFTLVFTIEEDYREIGIMKAVGMKGFAIKKLYLIKYLVLVASGSIIGLAASVPASSMMVKGVSKNMIMEDAGANLWVNIICTLLIILLVMLFCYCCTNRLNKVSAIAAIRGGQTGERYSGRGGIRLHRRSRMPVAVFLGINDMLSHVRRYLVMIITFGISFVLITIPLNTINTMKSSEMASKFCLDPDSAVYVKDIEKQGEGSFKSSKDLIEGMERVRSELKDAGYDAELTGIPIYFLQYEQAGKTGKSKIATVQALGPNTGFMTYQEGSAPVLENEIAFSKDIMKENGWEIGDSIEAAINGKEEKFIITGIYSDYTQLGRSARMNPVMDCSNEIMFDYWSIIVDMDTDSSQSEMAEELNKLFPDYGWSDAQEVIDRNVGGIQQSLQEMMIPMTALLCAIIMLITFLMERLFIVREKGEIAMMKSIGYRNGYIRLWQILRMIWAAVISMAAAVPLSLLANHFVLRPIFAIMGAELKIQVIPWQVYGVYPGILMAGIIIAAGIGTINVKKINIRELSNLE
ncbi:FtsX-like permease family protein [Murimonas intestini]|uniref:FtsX-like permease family protein n=1 Tax=Murimonas intestini TaxID=1337051 RepID=UPI00248CCE80|nr:ABC transporter permease [Murimonas intestini]